MSTDQQGEVGLRTGVHLLSQLLVTGIKQIFLSTNTCLSSTEQSDLSSATVQLSQHPHLDFLLFEIIHVFLYKPVDLDFFDLALKDILSSRSISSRNFLDRVVEGEFIFVHQFSSVQSLGHA